MIEKYGWLDFEEDLSGDIPEGGRQKMILTIGTLDEFGFVDNELAVIVHRMSDTLDNEKLMDEKRRDAVRIVDALNASDPVVIPPRSPVEHPRR